MLVKDVLYCTATNFSHLKVKILCKVQLNVQVGPYVTDGMGQSVRLQDRQE